MSNPPSDFIDPFDDSPALPLRDRLARLGFVSPAPALVNDAELPGRLWELLYALAARRMYFRGTNNLSDRDFFAWLHERWLPQRIAGAQFEAEFNCAVDVADASNEETQDKEWTQEIPGETLAPHGEPAHDRDRWLPEPPLPLQDSDEEDNTNAWMADDHEEEDPLGLRAVDREIREEKARAAAEAGLEENPFAAPDSPAASADRKLAAELAACEPENWRRPLDELNRQGVVLPPPDELTDESLPAKVWELLHELACRGFYVLHSDHLTDRELYAALWKGSLREPAMLPGRCRNGGWFHDFTGSGSPEHTTLWLRYYASEEDRERYSKEDWFTGPLPPHEQPPCHRDWRLPKGPF